MPAGYDSWFEYDLCKLLGNCQYHVDKVPYVQRRTYEPDFLFVDDYGNITYIEAKGRFRDRDEARKYVDVKESLGEAEELVFIFADPRKKMPHARRRQDGTFYTMEEWAKKHGFRWFTSQTLPKEWRG